MKRSNLYNVVIGGLIACAALALGACSLFQGQSLPNLQAQIASQCVIVNGDLAVIASSPLVSASDQALIANKILPANKAVCAGVATLNVNADDLKTLHDSLLPAAIAIVQGLPNFPNQTAILLGLNTFGPLVQQEVDQLITAIAAKNAAAAASSPLAASAIK